MSQNSLVLPTTGTVSGLSMTQATNNALDTLNTLASGPAAPASPEAGQLWHDTANNILKILSLDSTTWIPLFSLNESGYVSSPSFGNAVAGATRNLVIAQTGNATASISADAITVSASLGGASFNIASLGVTLNCASTGANGLDTGALAASSFYSIYAIYKPSTNTMATLATLSSTSSGTIYSGANMPAGYTMSALIGFMATNGSSHFVVSTQLDREIFLQSPVSVLSLVTGQGSLTSQSLSAAVPPAAKTCSGFLSYGGTGSDAMAVAADSTGTGLQQGTLTGSSVAGLSGVLNFRHLPLITSQTMFWRTGGISASAASLTISSFTF